MVSSVWRNSNGLHVDVSIDTQEEDAAADLVSPDPRALAGMAVGWGKLPKGNDIRMEGQLDKQTLELTWRPRYVALSRDSISFARSQGAEVSDVIPIMDVVRVTMEEEEEFLVDAPLKRKPSTNGFMLANLVEPSIKGRNFNIFTVANGFNSGRTYTLRAPSNEVCTTWVRAIEDCKRQEEKRIKSLQGKRSRIQYRVRIIYTSPPVQFFLAILIMFNFLVSVMNYQLLPIAGSSVAHVFDSLELFFIIIFSVELVANMISTGLPAFFLDGWNVRHIH
eukprot:755843-Hanusia_phi.AAC.1